MAPIGLLALVGAPIVGRNMNKLNLRLAASFAFCVFAFAIFWAATLNDTASFAQFATPRFLQGLGIAFFFLPLNQIMLSGIPPSDLASASGLSNFVRTMSGSIATALTVFMWNRRTDYHHISEPTRCARNHGHGRVSIRGRAHHQPSHDLGGQ